MLELRNADGDISYMRGLPTLDSNVTISFQTVQPDNIDEAIDTTSAYEQTFTLDHPYTMSI